MLPGSAKHFSKLIPVLLEVSVEEWSNPMDQGFCAKVSH